MSTDPGTSSPSDARRDLMSGITAVLGANGLRALLLARSALPYLGVRKIVNLLRCEYEKFRRRAVVRARPYAAIFDVTNLCNLTCPNCPTGVRRDAGRTQRTMPVELIERVLDEIGPWLISANLFNWGEPFAHPEIARIVGQVHARRIFTQISSNFSVSRREAILETCRVGLDYLTVSISGATREIYGKYHRHGRLAVVLDNLRAIAELKRAGGRRTPVVELKYLLFRHNEHEVEKARALARELGVDLFRVVRGGGEPEAQVTEEAAVASNLPTRLCHQLWPLVVVNSDGGLLPCCNTYFKADDFAELSASKVVEARNNARFVIARRLFDPVAVEDLPENLQHPCLKCSLVHDVPHLKAYLAANPHAAVQARTGGA